MQQFFIYFLFLCTTSIKLNNITMPAIDPRKVLGVQVITKAMHVTNAAETMEDTEFRLIQKCCLKWLLKCSMIEQKATRQEQILL
jgi:hypothetical protein